MEKENVTRVSLNLYDGDRSGYAEFEMKNPPEVFSYGDYFGCDGKLVWLSVDDDRTEEFEEDFDEEPELQELHDMLKDILNDLF